MTDDYLDWNRKNWNERARIHAKTAFYDLDGFVAGRKSGLHPDDPAELGSVEGKSLVHLQCHLGLETLGWARLGALRVVGLDFSPDAIAEARALAARSGLEARAEFVLSDVYDAPRALAASLPFDIVYVSAGALLWLPSVRRWAEVIARVISPGGVLFVREAHPMVLVVEARGDRLIAEGPYFERELPTRFDDPQTYADAAARLTNTGSFEWNHGLGEIVQALIDVGFSIELLREHRHSEWQAFPHMTRDERGLWCLPAAQSDVLPLTFSLRARKLR